MFVRTSLAQSLSKLIRSDLEYANCTSVDHRHVMRKVRQRSGARNRVGGSATPVTKGRRNIPARVRVYCGKIYGAHAPIDIEHLNEARTAGIASTHSQKVAEHIPTAQASAEADQQSHTSTYRWRLVSNAPESASGPPRQKANQLLIYHRMTYQERRGTSH